MKFTNLTTFTLSVLISATALSGCSGPATPNESQIENALEMMYMVKGLEADIEVSDAQCTVIETKSSDEQGAECRFVVTSTLTPDTDGFMRDTYKQENESRRAKFLQSNGGWIYTAGRVMPSDLRIEIRNK